jgi:hypothetical protein
MIPQTKEERKRKARVLREFNLKKSAPVSGLTHSPLRATISLDLKAAG